jgi:hypothetical protein
MPALPAMPAIKKSESDTRASACASTLANSKNAEGIYSKLLNILSPVNESVPCRNMTQLVKHAPPRQLLLRETRKDSVNLASRFARLVAHV